MNAITHRAAYALYPFNAFGSMAGVCFDHNTFSGPSHKCRRRGYDIRSVIEDTAFPGLGEEVTRGDRYVGDEYTWVVNFDTEYVLTILFVRCSLNLLLGRAAIWPPSRSSHGP